jgi:hypothetical protein
MWGDSVNELSWQAKKANNGGQDPSKKCVGDKIDLGVCYKDRNSLLIC